MTLKNTDTHLLVAMVALAAVVASSCGRGRPRDTGQRARVSADTTGRPGEYRMSPGGLDRIRAHEAFVPRIYDDGVGNRTIGYGHMLRAGESYDGGISEVQARELFMKDVARIVNPALARIRAQLTQNQIDALGSFIYNVGPGNFLRSVLPELNTGDHEGVIAAMARYVRGRNQRTGERVTLRGLLRRRGEEAALYRTPGGRISLAPADWSRAAHRLLATAGRTVRTVDFACSVDSCRRSRSLS